mmetsp:Transcript_30482/g.60640  ORF Transcript_30482/g.60640 Transcript_30482/m.60640 type:complete len:213 (+) Transcript_30482:92-730(+)
MAHLDDPPCGVARQHVRSCRSIERALQDRGFERRGGGRIGEIPRRPQGRDHDSACTCPGADDEPQAEGVFGISFVRQELALRHGPQGFRRQRGPVHGRAVGSHPRRPAAPDELDHHSAALLQGNLIAHTLRLHVDWKPARPKRFSWFIGLGLASVCLTANLLEVTWLFRVALFSCWTATWLEAACGFCVGCFIWNHILTPALGLKACEECKM